MRPKCRDQKGIYAFIKFRTEVVDNFRTRGEGINLSCKCHPWQMLCRLILQGKYKSRPHAIELVNPPYIPT